MIMIVARYGKISRLVNILRFTAIHSSTQRHYNRGQGTPSPHKSNKGDCVSFGVKRDTHGFPEVLANDTFASVIPPPPPPPPPFFP